MASETGGVWRTVGGRRIFIKDGQDLASAMKESGKFKPSKKQKDEGKRLNEKAKKSAKEDIEEYLKGNNENWDNDEEFVKELSDEYALDRNEVQKMFNYQKYVHDMLNNEDYIRENMSAGVQFSRMLDEAGVKTFADEIKQKESGYETYLRDTQGTTNEKLINAGRESDKRVDYQKYKNETIRTINKYRMEKGTTSLQQAYKKAFQEYKKLHPNTKLNLEKFIKMSEE